MVPLKDAQITAPPAFVPKQDGPLPEGLDPQYVGALINRGVMLMDQGQLEAARKHFARALEIRPGYVEARLNLEEVQKRKNDGATHMND